MSVRVAWPPPVVRASACACVLAACSPGASDTGAALPNPDTAQAGIVPTASPPPPPSESMAEAPNPRQIPLEDVAKEPRPGTAIPVSIAFTPDGTRLTYLYSPAGTLVRDLFVHDPATGERRMIFTPPEGGATEENLSEAEKLQRERQRVRSLGVTQYRWAKEADRFLVPNRGDVWVQEGTGGRLIKIVDTDGAPALDARFSPDGDTVAYVLEDELYTVPAGGGEPTRVTRGASGTGKTHGLAEYIAQEEMDRHEGYWWSHDSRWLAYTEVDPRGIPIYAIEHQGKARPYHEDHAYPFAGERNVVVKLGVVPADGGVTRWLDLNATGIAGDRDKRDLYLARVHWLPNGTLLAEVENREQSRLDLVRFDPRDGAASLVLTETSETWINLDHLFRALDEVEGELAGGFLWGSERSGFRHLYLYDASGTLVRALTEGEWIVDGVAGIDQKAGLVYFTGTKDGPTERHLYRVPLAGGPVEKLSEGAGMHGIVMNREATRFVDVLSALAHPPKITVHEAEGGKKLADVAYEPDPRVALLALEPPELVTVTTRDGVALHGAVYKPEGTGPFPTIVSVYGGPHAQRVQNDWSLTVDMRAQFLRSLGYLVWTLDNRGSSRRGLAFEGAIRHDLGNIEIQDQVDGVKWLVEQGLADPARVGIYGWSYGGYMAALALGRAPETFKVAVAGAPVTHWDGYDTFYTERYLGLPQANPQGYARSSVMAHVEAMRGKLLLVHGLIDENVHFRHTARLVNALIAARKDYELLLFPDERHMPRSEGDRVYMEQRVADFFAKHL